MSVTDSTSNPPERLFDLVNKLQKDFPSEKVLWEILRAMVSASRTSIEIVQLESIISFAAAQMIMRKVPIDLKENDWCDGVV